MLPHFTEEKKSTICENCWGPCTFILFWPKTTYRFAESKRHTFFKPKLTWPKPRICIFLLSVAVYKPFSKWFPI